MNATKVEKKYEKRSYDPMLAYTGFKKIWEITPDFWKPQWGKVKVLGYVRADNEWLAKYAAFNKGLIPFSAGFGSFGVNATEVDSFPVRKQKSKE